METASSRAWTILRTFLLPILVLGACDSFGQVWERLGLGLDSGGAIIVIYAACPKEQVTHVSLTERPEGVEPGEPGVVRWSIEGESTGLLEIRVGTVPAGFAESVALRGPLSSGSRYTIAVDSHTQDIASESFGLDELREDSLLSHPDKYVSRHDFDARAARICEEVAS